MPLCPFHFLRCTLPVCLCVYVTVQDITMFLDIRPSHGVQTCCCQLTATPHAMCNTCSSCRAFQHNQRCHNKCAHFMFRAQLPSVPGVYFANTSPMAAVLTAATTAQATAATSTMSGHRTAASKVCTTARQTDVVVICVNMTPICMMPWKVWGSC